MSSHIQHIPDINEISVARTSLMCQFSRTLGYHSLESAIEKLTWASFDLAFSQWAKDIQFTSNHREQNKKGTYIHQREFALSQGYKNVAQAIAAMGKETFKKAFQVWHAE